MNQEIDIYLNWSMDNIPPAFAYGTCVSPFGFHYLEDLIEDMVFTIFGKGSKPLQGMIESVNPPVYQPIRQQLRSKKPLSTEDTFVKEVAKMS